MNFSKWQKKKILDYSALRITVKRKTMSDNKIVYKAMKDFGFQPFYTK